MVKVASVPAPW